MEANPRMRSKEATKGKMEMRIELVVPLVYSRLGIATMINGDVDEESQRYCNRTKILKCRIGK